MATDKREQTEISTANGQHPVSANGAGRHIDLTDLRHAAEVDFAAAQAARRDAVEMMREAATLSAVARQSQEEARQALREAARLREDATLDELTGALRRNGGFVALTKEVDRARRTGGDLVIGFVDVDGLKEVNDTAGHAAGDELLRNVVAALHASLRSYDVLVRYGGDEFVFSLAGATLPAAERRFETMRVMLDESAPGKTVSAGFAQLRPEDDIDAVIRRADIDLYRRRARPPHGAHVPVRET